MYRRRERKLGIAGRGVQNRGLGLGVCDFGLAAWTGDVCRPTKFNAHFPFESDQLASRELFKQEQVNALRFCSRAVSLKVRSMKKGVGSCNHTFV